MQNEKHLYYLQITHRSLVFQKVRWVVGSIPQGGPNEPFLVLHDWCNKGRGMCNPVCGMVHIKEPLLLSEKVAHVAAEGYISRYLNGPLPYV